MASCVCRSTTRNWFQSISTPLAPPAPAATAVAGVVAAGAFSLSPNGGDEPTAAPTARPGGDAGAALADDAASIAWLSAASEPSADSSGCNVACVFENSFSAAGAGMRTCPSVTGPALNRRCGTGEPVTPVAGLLPSATDDDLLKARRPGPDAGDRAATLAAGVSAPAPPRGGRSDLRPSATATAVGVVAATRVPPARRLTCVGLPATGPGGEAAATAAAATGSGSGIGGSVVGAGADWKRFPKSGSELGFGSRSRREKSMAAGEGDWGPRPAEAAAASPELSAAAEPGAVLLVLLALRVPTSGVTSSRRGGILLPQPGPLSPLVPAPIPPVAGEASTKPPSFSLGSIGSRLACDRLMR